MITESTPVCVDTPLGPLHVAVMHAERRSWHEVGKGDVTALRPMLRVATDPTFEADPNHADHFTYRRRAYAVHYEVYCEERNGERWHRGGRAPYAGGFRNDRRGEVEWRTATFDALWQAVTAGLDAFAAATPGWEGLSRYMLLHSEVSAATSEAADLRRKAEKLDLKADALIQEAAPHLGSVPAETAALYLHKEK